MAVLDNWVKLEVGVRKRLHFYNHAIVARQITDPVTKLQVQRRTLLLYVDREDGFEASKVYSVMSEKHAGEFAGYLTGSRYVGYEFTVVKDAAGPVAPRVAEVRPYVP